MKPTTRRAPQREKAIEFLENYLSKGTKWVRDVNKAAEQEGISKRTVKDAASHLNVLKTQKKGQRGWFWSLPDLQNIPVMEGPHPARTSFQIAFEKVRSAGYLNDPFVNRLATNAFLAIEEAEQLTNERLHSSNRLVLDFMAEYVEAKITNANAIERDKVTPQAKYQIQLEVLQRAYARHGADHIYLPTIGQLKTEFIKEYLAAMQKLEIESDV